MDAIVPLLVLAAAVWSRLGRRVLRREDVGRLVGDTVARIRALEAGARDAIPIPPAPPAAARSAPPAAAAPPVPAARPAVGPERIPRERVAPRPVPTPDAAVVPAPVAPTEPPEPRAVVRRRRLAVRRDLVATELLAAPVSLRPGGATWR